MTYSIKFGKDNFTTLTDVDKNNSVVNISCKTVIERVNDLQMRAEYAKELQTLENVHVLYSGGIDSEIVVESCIEAGIDFAVDIMQYTIDGQLMNAHDMKYAINYCDEHNIKPFIHTLEITKFIESGEYIQYAQKYRCNSPQLCCHLWLLDQIDGFCIVGGDPLQFVLNEDKEYGLVYKKYNYLTYDRYFAINNKPGIGSMATYSIGIILASLKHQYDILVQRKRFYMVFDGDFEAINYDYRCMLYGYGGFKAGRKPSKYTGFESIRLYYSDKYNEKETVREFNKRFRKPLENIVSQPCIDNLKVLYPVEVTDLLKKFGEYYDQQILGTAVA